MAYLVTHSPEQLKEWEAIVVSNPSRAVRAIGIAGATSRTREGDTPADIYPALAAIAEAARRETEPTGYDGTQWETLVTAGVVDQLCKVITTLSVLNLRAGREDTPQHMLDAIVNDVPTPYQLPLEILGNAISNIQDPSSSAARKLISTVKRHWRAMSQRIWDEPVNSLLPTESHVLARVVYAQLCLLMINTDPSIVTIIYGPDDPTIPIVSRYWQHSTHNLDIKLTTQCLWWLLEPQHQEHIKFVRAHGAPEPEIRLSRILSVLGPKPTSSKATQAAALVSVSAKHLHQSTDVSLNFSLRLLLEVQQTLEKSNDAVVQGVIRKSGAIWTACLGILRKLSEKPESVEAVSAVYTLAFMNSVLRSDQPKDPAEREPLVKLWIDQGLFDVLDKQMNKLIMMRDGQMELARMLLSIHAILDTASPVLKQRLSGQFPRWKAIGILLGFDLKQQAGGNRLVWIQASWQCFAAVQNACFDWSLCGRRSCGKKGEIKCQCEEVSYCSEVCRKKDAEAHEFACRHMYFIRHGDDLSSAPSGEPEPKPVSV